MNPKNFIDRAFRALLSADKKATVFDDYLLWVVERRLHFARFYQYRGQAWRLAINLREDVRVPCSVFPRLGLPTPTETDTLYLGRRSVFAVDDLPSSEITVAYDELDLLVQWLPSWPTSKPPCVGASQDIGNYWWSELAAQMHKEQRSMPKEQNEIAAAIDSLALAVRRVASGGTYGPDGLEALAMSLAGEGLRNSVAQAIQEHGESIEHGFQTLSDAINNFAAALRGQRR